MFPVALPDLVLLAAVLAGAGAFLLALGALGLLEAALARLVLSLSPRAAHDQRLQTALDRYRPARGAQPHKRRRPMIHVLREPLFCAGLAALWLLPCALQDYRTRRVSNWLTVPFFLLAWPVAFLTGHLALTFAVFVGVYVASQVEPRFGGADAKLMVGLAALAPLGLGFAVLLEAVTFGVLRLRGKHTAAIPGVLWLYAGAVLSAAVLLVARAR